MSKKGKAKRARAQDAAVIPPNPKLDEHACAIRALGKRAADTVTEAAIDIGGRLTECKRICGHGNWLPWLKREFGWDVRTAQRYMSVHALAFKNDTVSYLALPLRSIFALAARSTPEDAVSEVIAHARSGEHLTHAKVEQTIRRFLPRPQTGQGEPMRITAPERSSEPRRLPAITCEDLQNASRRRKAFELPHRLQEFEEFFSDCPFADAVAAMKPETRSEIIRCVDKIKIAMNALSEAIWKINESESHSKRKLKLKLVKDANDDGVRH
jgi:hypothetical protein